MANHLETEIMQEYEARGFDVLTMKGLPDFLCLKDGKITFVEVKSKNDRLTEAQLETIKTIRHHRFKVAFEGAGSERASRDYKRFKRWGWF